jgi:hypothetical protein
MKNKFYLIGTIVTILLCSLITQNWTFLLLAPVSFVQNMAFTASSRSRNSGNPGYHYWIAMVSNGVWFLTSFFFILPNMQETPLFQKAMTMIVYIVSTSYGSSLMMEIMLKKETGKNKVGATK